MDDVGLAAELLNALDDFDARTAPFGLYASEEFQTKGQPYPRLRQEWKSSLTPMLMRLGCRPRRANLSAGEFYFDLSDGTPARMNLVRTSKIKVRKFGSAYRIDPHQRYNERWQGLRLDRIISDLWRPAEREGEDLAVFRLCLFIGFAVEAAPFQKELDKLHEHGRWEEHNLNYQTRSWVDRYDRHFSVRLSAWSVSRQM